MYDLGKLYHISLLLDPTEFDKSLKSRVILLPIIIFVEKEHQTWFISNNHEIMRELAQLLADNYFDIHKNHQASNINSLSTTNILQNFMKLIRGGNLIQFVYYFHKTSLRHRILRYQSSNSSSNSNTSCGSWESLKVATFCLNIWLYPENSNPSVLLQ